MKTMCGPSEMARRSSSSNQYFPKKNILQETELTWHTHEEYLLKKSAVTLLSSKRDAILNRKSREFWVDLYIKSTCYIFEKPPNKVTCGFEIIPDHINQG
ncbi:hypothetical protein TNCT_571051 [Trichonephila clavata]|uniref:Uncharacterized protein n=1 Tax=Trichonephila clavata TaxID=2740835 RepID=A0A8X6J1W7_TRICU|nr:hypothetical protein TNCT_571051 [Trichonephila clavata]